MKNTPLKAILFFATIFTVLSSCVTPSVHPIYHKSDAIRYNDIHGEWIGSGSIWIFEEEPGPSYRLTYRECPDPINDPTNYSECTLAEFRVNILKLNDEYFADFLPINYTNTTNKLLLFHVRTLHSFAKISVLNNQLFIAVLDNDWLEELVKKQPGIIEHTITEEGVLLTAETDELQEFIKKYSSSKEAFANSFILQRR